MFHAFRSEFEVTTRTPDDRFEHALVTAWGRNSSEAAARVVMAHDRATEVVSVFVAGTWPTRGVQMREPADD